MKNILIPDLIMFRVVDAHRPQKMPVQFHKLEAAVVLWNELPRATCASSGKMKPRVDDGASTTHMSGVDFRHTYIIVNEVNTVNTTNEHSSYAKHCPYNCHKHRV